MDHFGMELDAVEARAGRGDGGDGAGGGAAGDGKPGGAGGDHVAMAHPDLLAAGEAGEQRVGRTSEIERGQAVFAAVALAHLAAQQVRHQLLAVADAEHGDAEAKIAGSTVGLPGS